MNIVLFLGAGFSHAWGLPLMNDFFDFAKHAGFLPEPDREFLVQLRGQAQEAHRMLEVRPHNMEDILSLCFASGSFADLYPEEASAYYTKLCHILFQVYRRVRRGKLDYWKVDLGLLRSFLRVARINPSLKNKLTIITTNYDVVLEYILAQIGLSCHLPCEWDALSEPPNRSAPSLYNDSEGPLLCKLHGSINWFLSKDKGRKLQIENWISRGGAFLDGGNSDFPEHVIFPTVANEGYEPPLVPLIVPPIVFKMQPHACFQSIWGAAGKALQEADGLVFVGYSFPDSDTYLRYFLAMNLCKKPDLDYIRIIDPKATEICDRLKKSNFGSYFKGLLNPFNGLWQKCSI